MIKHDPLNKVFKAEFKVVSVLGMNPDDLQDAMNKLSDDGFELIDMLDRGYEFEATTTGYVNGNAVPQISFHRHFEIQLVGRRWVET